MDVSLGVALSDLLGDYQEIFRWLKSGLSRGVLNNHFIMIFAIETFFV